MATATAVARHFLSQSCRVRTPLDSSRTTSGLVLRPTNPPAAASAATATSRRHTPTQVRHSSSSSSARPPATGKFSYSVAASYIAKDRPFDPTTHVFHFDPHNSQVLRRPGRRLSGGKASRPESGQDAFFVSRVGPAGGNGVALGVADGVGGWMDRGVDPADFSHGLCEYAADEASHYGEGNRSGSSSSKGAGGSTALTARRVMQGGYEAVCRDPAILAGGSTAVVGLLGETGQLEVANLGDSGFIHLRLNGVHAYSEPQTHAFNTPFQMSVVPPGVMLRMAAFGGAQLSDLPRDADVTRLSLQHGDVLVFASDGLWDNLFNQDVLRIVSRTMTRTGAWVVTDSGIKVVADLDPHTSLDGQREGGGGGADAHAPVVTLQSLLATALVGAAKAASVNTKLDGPFAKEAKRYYPLENWRGGKVDDICVVAVVVSEVRKERPTAKL